MDEKICRLLMRHDAERAASRENGGIVVRHAGGDLGGVIARAYARLPEGDELFVCFDNKYGYDRLFRRKERHGTLLSPRAVNNMLYRAGFRRQRIYSLYPDATRPSEMFRLGSAVCPAAEATAKGRLRAALLRHPLLRVFHPAYAFVAVKGRPQRPSFLDALAGELGVAAPYRIVVGNPATVLLIGGEQVVRLPLDGDSSRRCRRNRRMLQALAAAPAAAPAPQPLRSGTFRGQEYYAERRLPGIAVDTPGDDLEPLVEKAASFITAFHCRTVRRRTIGERQFERLFARHLARLARCLDAPRRARLAAVQRRLRAQMLGRQLPLVWAHGDYKLENVLFDRGRRRISGIIDWDLARREALPLPDLIYLLMYDAARRGGEGIMELFRARFLPQRFTPFERRLVGAYCGALGIAPELRTPLLVAAWLEHVARRCDGLLAENEGNETSSAWIGENVGAVVDQLGEHA